jgi:dynein heavy chain
LPPIIDKEEHAKEIFKLTNKGLLQCLSTVLLQEIERYNRLLTKMGTSLSSLMKAIKGLVIMSPELDLMYTALSKNQVPPNWAEVAYPSIKSLASWIKDLNLRVEFMRSWLKGGHPSCYWLSGFFFPHGFMTGTLQTFARKHNKAIDTL